MKKLLSLVAAATLSFSSFGQAPEGFKYQAVVRDAGNIILNNQTVGLRMTIQQGSIGGTTVYAETFAPTTNAYGLVNLEIGNGTVVSGTFTDIDWSAGPFYMETAVDVTGGTNYSVMGTSQLMSVPYALYAKTSGNGQGPAGPQGIQGPAGEDGTNGLDGAAGPQGAQGIQGVAGINGAVGATGPQGIQGIDGTQGPAGNNGMNGLDGNGIASTTDNGDGTFTLTFDDGSTFVTSNLTGPQGATGSLPSGAIAGNTPYWNGSAWVVNNSNIHNNGVGVGIGTTSPNASAKVEIASTTQGFLPPRLTSAERDAIASPAVGLVIYNTTTNCLNFYVGSGWNETCGIASSPSLESQYPAGSVFCAFGPTAIVDVTNPTTGKIWMDRNLGATQVATSSTDANSYGDLYQWGRRSDGHQCRTSPTTTTLSSVNQPANGNFILAPNTPGDWRSPQNTNLWQGVNGVNNPCPSGYRLPSVLELDAELLSWSANTSSGAFASPLRLPMAGYRILSDGSLDLVGTVGCYWSGTVNLTNSLLLYFDSSFGDSYYTAGRAYGLSVRCIKD